MSDVTFGIDQVVRGQGAIEQSARLGLVTNDAARLAGDANLKSRAALRQAGFNLVRLFGPEHGIAATAADGAAVADSIDPITGVPVVSLYGSTHRPAAEHLRDLDLVLFDIPDVGARFYTYIWTLSHLLEACADARKPLVVLDRPNPLGGELDACEGPILDEAQFSTFVGRWNIPIRYGLTIGELATLWNLERKIGADLRVIPVENWRREMHWPDTGLPFVPSSPAMPSYETALAYPGSCLFEGTNLSEGRGTDAPFRTIGAPWVDAGALREATDALDLPGVQVQAAWFQSEARKYVGKRCGGIRLHITDPRGFRPVATSLHLLAIFLRLHPDRVTFTPYPTTANESGGGHFDRLMGTRDIRLSLQRNPDPPAEQIIHWTAAADWPQRVRPHLLYE